MSASEQGAAATDGRWMSVARALCFVCHGDDVLMMKRSPDKKIFPNYYNGLGGHIERDEDPLSSIRREVLEESGLHIHSIKLCAVYNIDAGHTSGILMFIFRAQTDSLEFVSDDREGTLHWVAKGQLLELDLVEDLPYILPRILEMDATSEPFYVHVSYNEDDHLIMNFAES